MTKSLLHHNLFSASDRLPQHIAYRIGQQNLSYADLDKKSNQLAYSLNQLKVKCGDRVGIFLPKGLESVIAVYGILKAGASYVPIDPDAPVARISTILDNCNISVVVTDQSRGVQINASAIHWQQPRGIIGCSAPTDTPLSCRWIEWRQVYDCPTNRFEATGISTDQPAYIMFTSGSTGIPKGIVHTHASGQAYARMSVDTYQITRSDRIGNHAPLHFDISTLGYLSSPLAGATTVFIPEVHTRMPASMSQLAEDEQLTIWYSVPFALIQMLNRGALEKRDLSALRLVMYGGEPFSPRQIRALMDLWPAATFSNVYGPAEVNQCHVFNIPTTLNGADEDIPIGDYCPHAKGIIVDAQNNPVTPGETGELLIHSAAMMKGYWQRDDLNTRCFYQSPADNDQYYRTGDLASQAKDGLFHYHGRKDRLIKIRGNRIELDEIEAALTAHDGISEAAVYVIHGGTENEYIEACVLAARNEEVAMSVLGDFIKHRLPKYAIPDSIIALNDFPRTTSGKIDRKQLQQSRQSELLTHANVGTSA